MRYAILLAVISTTLLLGACGRKGALVLPTPPKAPPIHVPAAP